MNTGAKDNQFLPVSRYTVMLLIQSRRVEHHLTFVYLTVFNATFNNMSVILWRSVLLVEETGVPGEIHHHYTQTNTNNINKTSALLQTTGRKRICLCFFFIRLWNCSDSAVFFFHFIERKKHVYCFNLYYGGFKMAVLVIVIKMKFHLTHT